MKGEFWENVVVLTGASSGIGEQMAYQLAEQGAWLVLAARNGERLTQVGEKCRHLGAKTITVPTDVAIESHCENLIDQAVQTFGRVDTLVCNAGITMWAKFADMQTLQPLHDMMHVNYFGAVYCTYYALPHLIQSQGRLVAMASVAGKAGIPLRSGYAASKHALFGFFDSLRIELLDTGVTVTMIAPALVKSETHKKAFGADGQPLGVTPLDEGAIMPASTCAKISLNAIAQRKREEIMTLRGKVGMWVKLLAPTFVDNMAKKAIEQGK
jgi:short-subunit dehydrogenase